MDSIDKSFTILGSIGLVTIAIVVCAVCWFGVETAKVEANKCEQCKLIKEKGK